jgi:uncharacterized membrane protein
MESTTSPGPPGSSRSNEIGAVRALINAIRTRIISGLILALPIVLTFWIIYQIYSVLTTNILGPAADLVRFLLIGKVTGAGSRFWWDQVAAPLIAIVAVLALLYFLGWIVRSRLLLAVDWVLLRLPVVTTIYKTLNNVFQSLGNTTEGNRFKRVVLVAFPHPGARSLGFVTHTLHDVKTGKTILCVCVLTGVMPPAGFTIFVPEESVTDVNWSVNETLQAILSGGITAPEAIPYFEGLPVSAAAGPIVDPHGHPIATHRDPEKSGARSESAPVP